MTPNTAGSRVLVRAAYVAQYPNPVAFRAGETVQVGDPDTEFPEWFWCRGPDAREGWVHSSFLSRTMGRATGARDYSAKELTVEAGATGRVVHVLGEWAYLQRVCRDRYLSRLSLHASLLHERIE